MAYERFIAYYVAENSLMGYVGSLARIRLLVSFYLLLITTLQICD